MRQITGGGSLTRNNLSDINFNFQVAGQPFTPGNVVFCDPATANTTSNQDGSQDKPYQSFATAYGVLRNGKNDILVLVGNGGTGASARMTAAFTWAKDAAHLVGYCSPVLFSQRARIAPTSTATAYTPFFTVSGNGCIFQNIQFYQGFATGTTSQINTIVTGSRNYFKNCQFAGMADDASAQSAGSRSLKIGAAGSGENVFEDCVIGVDTITRTAANASLEFTGATTRNVFRRCIFPFMTSSATVLGIIGTGTENMDRFQLFEDCKFINAIGSTSTTMTALCTLAASSGGILVFGPGCCFVGITDTGSDATTFAQIYIGAPANSGTAGGAAVVAS